jgi:hypothetical protein
VTSAVIPGKEDFFYLYIESQHIAYHVGEEVHDNEVGLKPDELKKRKVFYLDIVGHKPPSSTQKVWRLKLRTEYLWPRHQYFDYELWLNVGFDRRIVRGQLSKSIEIIHDRPS